MEFDAVQDSGQKLSFGSTNRVTARRPDRARVEIDRRDGSRHGVVIDGRQITVYTETENVYATAAKSGNLEDSLDYPIAELEVPMPLSDVIRSDFPAVVLEGAAVCVAFSSVAGLIAQGSPDDLLDDV